MAPLQTRRVAGWSSVLDAEQPLPLPLPPHLTAQAGDVPPIELPPSTTCSVTCKAFPTNLVGQMHSPIDLDGSGLVPPGDTTRRQANDPPSVADILITVLSWPCWKAKGPDR